MEHDIELTYYCLNCKDGVCPACFYEKHKSHKKRSLKEVHQEATQKIKDRLERLKPIEQKYVASQNELTSKVDKIKEAHKAKQ